MEEGFIESSEVPDTDGFKPATKDFIDGNLYDGKKPIDYINSFAIGIKEDADKLAAMK